MLQANPKFRQTNAGIQLGRAVFDPKSQISPALITNLFISAGVPVPLNVRIGVDTAQIVMAGGAIASNISQGASFGAYAAPTALGIKAGVDLLTATGLMTANSPAAQILTFGADVTIVAACGGLNVLADLALAMDIIKSVFGKVPDVSGELKRYANAKSLSVVNNLWNSIAKGESPAAAKNFSDYQSGKISIFQLMGNIATESPDLFYNYFPEMKVFIPPNQIKIWASVNVSTKLTGGFFGTQSKTSSASSYSQLIKDTAHGVPEWQLVYGIAQSFLNDPMTVYNDLENGNNNRGAIKVADLAVLSMFPPYFDTITGDFDITPIMRSLAITPYDMGYNFIEDNIDKVIAQNNLSRKSPAVTMNGVDYSQTSTIDNSTLDQLNKLDGYDQSGDIESLAADPLGAKLLKEWGTSSALSAKDLALMPNYSNIKNYWSAISLEKLMASDPFFTSKPGYSQTISQMVEHSGGLFVDIDARHREIQLLSSARKMNRLARINIANFFNTSADKLKIAPLVAGKPGSVIM